MKRKITSYTFLFLMLLPLYSQVGINTNTAQGILHIDPKNDTSGLTNTTDDILIDSNGYMGIGTTTPSARLDVIGNMNIIDGSEANSKAMVSDANGLGTWQRLTYTTKIDGYVPDRLADIIRGNLTAEGFRYVGAYITLPAGQWQIYYYCIYNNNNNLNYTIWWDLTSSSSWVEALTPGWVGRVLSYHAPDNGLSPTYASYAVSANMTTTFYIHGCVALSTGNPPVGTETFTYNSGARLWAIPIY